MKSSKDINVQSYYTIVCGLFRFNENKLDKISLWNMFANWRARINNGEFEATFNYLNHSYYDSYLNNIFPEIRFDEDQIHTFNPDILNHLTLKDTLGGRETIRNLRLVIDNRIEIGFEIDFIDLYLFPHEIGIFTIKLHLGESEEPSLSRISDFQNGIRYLDSKIFDPHEAKTTLFKDFIKEKVLQPLNLGENWTIYNPQLKLYSMIDLDENLASDDQDYLLYDVGNVATIGSARGSGPFAPSKSYFDEQLSKNKISVFKNWSALALYDTFTRISLNFPDTFKSWENDYFNVYVHTIYTKFFMYLTNSELSDVTSVDKKTEKIRNRFIEFVNDYHHTQISYKFLPDLLRDKLLKALEIQSEIERMETKIQRINEQFQERREKSFNIALIVITLLSVFSVIYDVSEWLIKIGVGREHIYPYPSILSAALIFCLIYLIFRIKRK